MSHLKKGILKLLKEDFGMSVEEAEEFYERNTNDEAKRKMIKEIVDMIREENSRILEEIRKRRNNE